MNKKIVLAATTLTLLGATGLPQTVNTKSSIVFADDNTKDSKIIDTTANKLYLKHKKHDTKIGETYRFSGKLTDKKSWGPAADIDSHLIYVTAKTGDKSNPNDTIMLLTDEKTTKRLKKADKATFTVTLTKQKNNDKVGGFKVISVKNIK